MGPFRIAPALPAGAYKTYAVAAPLATHFRPASCAEANCKAHRSGWLTAVDETTGLGQGQAHYIRAEAGRRYTEQPGEDDAGNPTGLTVFEFPPGQRCFGRHQVPMDRPEIYTVRGGDWRGDPAGGRAYLHHDYSDWLDDFGTHQQNVADTIERG